MKKTFILFFWYICSSKITAQAPSRLFADPNIVWAAEMTLDFVLEPEYTMFDSASEYLSYSIPLKMINREPHPGSEWDVQIHGRLQHLFLDKMSAGACYADPELRIPLSEEKAFDRLVMRDTMITFDPETRPVGTEIPLDNIMGCPLVSARIGGQVVKLAVDTGARVTFLNPSLVTGERPVGHYDDFYITCGPFTCDSFEKRVRIGDISLDLIVGGLPPDLETGLGFMGLDGILGNDIFDHYPKVLYDLRGNMLTLYL